MPACLVFIYHQGGVGWLKWGGWGGGASQASPFGGCEGDKKFLFGMANEAVKEQLQLSI
jgi:hypothetical protein